MFWKQLFLGRIMNYQDEFLASFPSEAVEASIFHFLKNWWMKLKCPILLKPLDTIIQENYQSCYPSEPLRITRFKMRHPVGFPTRSWKTQFSGDHCKFWSHKAGETKIWFLQIPHQLLQGVPIKSKIKPFYSIVFLSIKKLEIIDPIVLIFKLKECS